MNSKHDHDGHDGHGDRGDHGDADSYWHPYFAPCMTTAHLLRQLYTKCFCMQMHLIDLRQLQRDDQAKQLFAMLRTRLVGRVVHQLCLPTWLGADLVDVAWLSKTVVRCLDWPSMFDDTEFARQVVAACTPWLVTLVVPHGVDVAKMEAITAGASGVKLVRPSKDTYNASGASGQCTHLAKQPGTYAPHNSTAYTTNTM